MPLQAMSGILNALLDISMLDSGSVAPKRSDFALAAVLDRIAAHSPPARSTEEPSVRLSDDIYFCKQRSGFA